MGSQSENPKVFISYSWSSPEHEEMVLSLATQLTGDGVDVVLDKWDLKEGQDIHAFMERMVTEDKIDRVLVICDKTYSEKADDRRGGVGTETQIISPDVYSKASQEKFLPVIFERDSLSGEPYVPVYLKGRFYIDLSTDETYTEGYQQLVRNLFGKPVHKRPALGKPPSFLLETTAPALLTTSKLQLFRDAVMKERANAPGLLADYFDALNEAFRQERIITITPEPGFDDKIVESIDHFRPYRDEFITLLPFLGRYAHESKYIAEITQGYEGLVQSKFSTPSTGFDESRDNLSFILWEMFLYTIASFIHSGRFEAVQSILEHQFFIETEQYSARGALRPYPVLEPPMRSLEEFRKNRLQIRRYSVSGDMLRERLAPGPIRFFDLVETDFILCLRSLLAGLYEKWWPRTMVYADNLQAFPQFQRAAFKAHFDRLKLVLGVTDIEQLRSRLPKNESQYPMIEGFWGGAARYNQLMNLDNLAKS